MISANQLQTLTTYGPLQLTELLMKSHQGEVEFASACFIGITNGWQFCYKVEPKVESQRGVGRGKVFLTYDHATGSVIAEY